MIIVQTGHTDRKTPSKELNISSAEEKVTDAVETSMFSLFQQAVYFSNSGNKDILKVDPDCCF